LSLVEYGLLFVLKPHIVWAIGPFKLHFLHGSHAFSAWQKQRLTLLKNKQKTAVFGVGF
tara:strand:+ start:1970 stop:2146 length:177 start_codon:yes stop_codon:yes gene_type:complete